MLAWVTKDKDGNYVIKHRGYTINSVDESYIKNFLGDLPKDEDLPIQIKI